MSAVARPRPASGRGPLGALLVAVACAGLVALPTFIGLDGMEGVYVLVFVAPSASSAPSSSA